jgi:hypothetical protein
MNMTAAQLEKILGNNTSMNMTAAQLEKILGNNTSMNMTAAQLEKILGNNTSMNMTFDKLQKLINNMTLGDYNDTVSASQKDLSNITKSLNTQHEYNITATNQTILNTILLHIVCTVKSNELGKLFDNMTIPLSSCHIQE